MPDPNRSLSRLPQELSRFGRSRTQRAVLLLVGGLLMFAIGRWSGEVRRPPAGAGGEVPAGVRGTPLVLDGDSLDFNGVRVRLYGIDAFERDQLCEAADGSRYPCGQLARESLLSAIGHTQVVCERRDVDDYGRMVAVCSGRDGDLSARLVADGLALAYRRYSSDYVDEEDLARSTGRGAWQGRFEEPWDYRHNAKERSKR